VSNDDRWLDGAEGEQTSGQEWLQISLAMSDLIFDTLSVKNERDDCARLSAVPESRRWTGV
jgi:hypothetical protein